VEKCLPIKFAVKFAACLALVSCFPSLSAAQQTTPPGADSSQQSSQPSTQQQTPAPDQTQTPAPVQQPADKDSSKDKDKDKDKAAADQTQGGQGKVEGTSNDRLFYTLPNFLTIQGKRLPPMSVGTKFKAQIVSSFDVIEYPWWGVLAAISQADNGDPAYRQGWGAYAKRYGSTAADSIVENFMVAAVFSSALHQDPRYYQSGKGEWTRRTGYAISRIFVTYSDSGKTRFNYSEIFGAGLAGAISTYTYHPRSTYISTPTNPHEFIASERTFDNVAQTWGTQIGLDTLTLVVKEFWPDIHRMMNKHKHSNDAGSQAGVKP
jgi:hypothetical protein